MKLNINSIHWLFWILSVLVFIPFLKFRSTDSTMDINIYDTYLVIHHYHVGVIFLFLLGGIGFVYWILKLLNRKRILWLGMTHFLLTFLSVVLFEFSASIFGDYKPEFYSNLPLIGDFVFFEVLYFIALLMLLVSQLFFAVYVAIGILLKKT